MSEFHVAPCTAEQLGTLARNEWKYIQIQGTHIRIRPRTPDFSINPTGKGNFTAEIEVLDMPDKAWGEADAEAQKVVEVLFSSVLKRKLDLGKEGNQ